jgi:hypothetical protein
MERERKRGCTCFTDRRFNREEIEDENIVDIPYYCPICEEGHDPHIGICKECFQQVTGIKVEKDEPEYF